MDTSQFAGQVRPILVDSIEVNPQNPRGPFDTAKDPSFERLVSSVKEIGVLVPIVVRRLHATNGHAKFQLVDGERRYWAAKAVGLHSVPAHVLSADLTDLVIRKAMFHLHMTREQWGPWAQCVALAEMYPELDHGIPVSKKDEWTQRIHDETGTSSSTARDRVRVLSWSKALKNKIEAFQERNPGQDVYSYVLAIEASVIEPSLEAFPEIYATPQVFKVNQVRESLLDKTLEGIETGTIASREVIRSVAPLFSRQLDKPARKTALKIFRSLVEQPGYIYEDARGEIAVSLPEVFAEKPPKLSRLISQIESLSSTLDKYQSEYVQRSSTRPTRVKELKKKLVSALKSLERAVNGLLDRV